MIVLTREQVRRIDRLALDRYGIPGVVLMENAGRNAASIIDDVYGPNAAAFICCGPGNNGGDGCVIARHLHNAGWSVRLMITGGEAVMSADTMANYRIVRAMSLDTIVACDADSQHAALSTVSQEVVLVDAILGTGFRGKVRGPTDLLIADMNSSPGRATVAVDVPSGLDCDTGEPSNATIRADLTVSFVAAKTGFAVPKAAPYVGRVEIADIGAPRELIDEAHAGPSSIGR